MSQSQESLISGFVSPAVMQSVAALDFRLVTDGKNPRIAGLLNETVLAGGKRLRPILAFMMADLFDLPHDKIAFYSRAIEMIHASSLAHDDVIDEATERRGRPSINIAATNKRAVLAGDYLLAQVLQGACQNGPHEIVAELARTIADLAEGEWLQIENAVRQDLSYDDVERVALKKTASVMRLCSLLPAMISGASSTANELASRFGEHLGLAFQLTDDILDLKRDDGSRLQDLKCGTINAVIFGALAHAAGSDKIDAGKMISAATFQGIDWESGLARAQQRLSTISAEMDRVLEALRELLGRKNTSSFNKAYGNIRLLSEYICHRV
jgi:octaprenyl-diphosphate synthase